MIIHAPSDTMDIYAGTPYRKRMQQAKAAKPPVPIAALVLPRPARRSRPCPSTRRSAPATIPVDRPGGPQVVDRQHAGLDIIGYDGISDNGEEIYNFWRRKASRTSSLMGVHTNMCVLGRSFGIRQMVRLGKNVVLARDLTDAMYDPRQPPYVSHARGTELVVEHIEKYWCPSILSKDLTQVIEGSADPAKPFIGSTGK